jgi:hypothetical protein
MTQSHPSVMSEARLKDDVFRVIRKKVDKATAFSAAKAGTLRPMADGPYRLGSTRKFAITPTTI